MRCLALVLLGTRIWEVCGGGTRGGRGIRQIPASGAQLKKEITITNNVI